MVLLEMHMEAASRSFQEQEEVSSGSPQQAFVVSSNQCSL
jgi:hypothetical protein